MKNRNNEFINGKKVQASRKLKTQLTALLLILAMLITVGSFNAMALQSDSTATKVKSNAFNLDLQDLSAIGADNSNSYTEQHTESVTDKISEEVQHRIEQSEETEKIPVWIWFKDIDQQEIEQQVELETGLSRESLEITFDPVPEEVRRALIEESSKEIGERQRDAFKEILQDYIRSTSDQREEERTRTNIYISARRIAARDAYIKNNQELIKELNLPVEDIVFQSQLTPSVIVMLTKGQIFNVSKSPEVITIDYYESTTDYPPPYYPNQRATMRADIAYECSGLTGNGVNILMHDQYVVRSDANYYNRVNPNNILALVNGTLYPVTNVSAFPGTNEDTHPNLVAGALQYYANDVFIYCVGKNYFSDIEWAIINLDIHLINGSINYGYGSSMNYSSDIRAKWFDAIVSTYCLTLIASAGNSESWWSYGWPNVISPANGYNSIAVGAYRASGNSDNDRMYNYRYNPVTGTDLVNYKPDIVVAAPSTSEASPALSGIVAMMIQLKPSLAANPELIKAILMASCHRKVLPASGTPAEVITDGLTQRQGAGAIDAYRALCIVLLGQYGIGSITSGYSDIDVGQLGTTSENVNVSLAWLRNNSYSPGYYSSSTLGALQELELSVLSGEQVIKTSALTNAGKQMVYFTPTSLDYTIRVTKASQNEEAVRYAFAWSAEDSMLNIEHEIIASPTDLTYEEGLFQYSMIQFFDNSGFYNNQNLYVVLKKYDESGLEFSSPIYTVPMNASSTGLLTEIAISMTNYTANEYIEILMYKDSASQVLLSRQLIRPIVFDMDG